MRGIIYPKHFLKAEDIVDDYETSILNQHMTHLGMEKFFIPFSIQRECFVIDHSDRVVILLREVGDDLQSMLVQFGGFDSITIMHVIRDAEYKGFNVHMKALVESNYRENDMYYLGIYGRKL